MGLKSAQVAESLAVEAWDWVFGLLDCRGGEDVEGI